MWTFSRADSTSYYKQALLSHRCGCQEPHVSGIGKKIAVQSGSGKPQLLPKQEVKQMRLVSRLKNSSLHIKQPGRNILWIFMEMKYPSLMQPFTVHTISSISVLMVIASSFSVRHICFYEWEPDHCAEDSRRRSYDVTSVSQMETSDDRVRNCAVASLLDS